MLDSCWFSNGLDQHISGTCTLLLLHALTHLSENSSPRTFSNVNDTKRRGFLNCFCLMCLETNCLFGTNVIVINCRVASFCEYFILPTIHKALFVLITPTKPKKEKKAHLAIHCQNSPDSTINNKMMKSAQLFVSLRCISQV